MTENKRVNIVDITTGVLMRTPRSYAKRLVEAGTHHYTSKGRLKKFLNREAKLHRNAKYFGIVAQLKTAAPTPFLSSGNKLHVKVPTVKLVKTKEYNHTTKEHEDKLDIFVTGKQERVYTFDYNAN